jgi:hypothetical protein
LLSPYLPQVLIERVEVLIVGAGKDFLSAVAVEIDGTEDMDGILRGKASAFCAVAAEGDDVPVIEPGHSAMFVAGSDGQE